MAYKFKSTFYRVLWFALMIKNGIAFAVLLMALSLWFGFSIEGLHGIVRFGLVLVGFMMVTLGTWFEIVWFNFTCRKHYGIDFTSEDYKDADGE